MSEARVLPGHEGSPSIPEGVAATGDESILATEEFLAERLYAGQYRLQTLETGIIRPERLPFGATHLDLSRDSFRPEYSPDAQTERLAQFESELQSPSQIQEHTTGSHYNVYTFNRDFQQRGGGDSAVVFIPSLSSYPSSEQAQAVIWRICQLFPEQLVISIGNEGTFDARASDVWLGQNDPLVIAETRRQCIMKVLEDSETQPKNINLIGQSMGGVIAFNLSRLMKVNKLIMMSTPIVEKNALSFCMELARQETPAILRAPWKCKKDFLRHLGKSVIPSFVCADAGRNLLAHRRLIESVPGSVRIEDRDPEVDISLITGERDKRTQYRDFLDMPGRATGTDVDSSFATGDGEGSNLLGITIRGLNHTDTLLDDHLCGQTIKLAWDCPRA